MGAYYLDVNEDTLPDYFLNFGPPWYNPNNGLQRPNDCEQISIVGGLINNDSIPMIVVYAINGIEWRDSTNIGNHLGGNWAHRNMTDSVYIHSTFDEDDWIHVGPGWYNGGGMHGGGMMTDSLFFQMMEVYPHNIPFVENEHVFAGYELGVFQPNGSNNMWNGEGCGGMMNFNSNINYNLHFTNQQINGFDSSPENIAAKYWDSQTSSWKKISNAIVNVDEGIVNFNMSTVSNYVILTSAIITFVEQENKSIIVDDYKLGQNYPNPFNPSTTINYQLPKAGDVTLKVFDTENDTTKVNKLLSSGQLDHLDMIIGPFYPSSFELVADFVKDKDVKLVTPVPQSNKVLLGNDNVIKVATSRVIQTKVAAAFVVDSFIDENIVVIRTNKEDDKLLAKAFKQNLMDILKETGQDSTMAEVNEVVWTTSRYAFGTVKDKIRADKRNLLFVPSSDLTFITDLLTKLNKDFEEYDITIIGKENWQRFDNIEVGYFHQLNVHLTTYLDIDELDSTYLKLVEYMHNQKQHPTKYTLLGADVGFYFLGMLNQYGTGFDLFLEEHKAHGMISDFDFFKTGMESGYENRSSNLLRYRDFDLIKVR